MMQLTWRRRTWQWLIVTGAALAVAVGGVERVDANHQEEDCGTADVVRLLEQATWGPTPELVDHVCQVGVTAFLEEQFAAPMSSYPTLPLYPTTRDTASCPNNSTCQRDNYTLYLLQNRFFQNAL